MWSTALPRCRRHATACIATYRVSPSWSTKRVAFKPIDCCSAVRGTATQARRAVTLDLLPAQSRNPLADSERLPEFWCYASEFSQIALTNTRIAPLGCDIIRGFPPLPVSMPLPVVVTYG